jgi:segregation and condensation protein A
LFEVTENIEHKEFRGRGKEYWAKLNEYEGPLDILLHFVKEDELNIYDIPISRLTKDFLEYINYMQKLDIEVAGEFLLLASELMKIKARMLLPMDVFESDEIEEDPRLTLVRKLLEYKRFKDATGDLSGYENEAKKRFFREYFKQDARVYEKDFENDPSLKNLNIYNLIIGFKSAILNVAAERKVHPIELLKVTPEIQREFLLNFFEKSEQIDFSELIKDMDEKMLIICTFLAMLQLALDGYIKIIVSGMDISKFSLKKTF